jgi:transposase
MTDVRLTNDQWTNIRDFLKQDPNAYVGNEVECRRFVEAVKWVSRSGAQWRLLPAEYGNWNSVYKRFARWCDNGVWERMLAYFANDPDLENGMVDSTIVRAHACAAGASKKTVDKRNRHWGAVEAALAPKSMSRWMGWAIRCGCI